MNLRFNKTKKDEGFAELQKRVRNIVLAGDIGKENRNIVLVGTLVFVTFVFGILCFWMQTTVFMYYILAVFLGMMCVPMILLIGHEAIHGNFTSYKFINDIGRNVFYFLGTSSYFWKLRHINAHHHYTNIRNWDLDIEQSKLIRLDHTQEWHVIHRFQAFYMPFLFLCYTLNWFFFRDFKDIFTLSFGTKQLKRHPISQICYLFCAKIWHLFFLIGFPIWLGHAYLPVIIGFFIFHFSASLTTTLVLVSTHIGEDHELLGTDTHEELPFSWAEHQIRTSGDFSTSNRFLLHFFGGFNHHLAHHLFPNVPYSLYPQITPLIKEFCNNNILPYHNYPSLVSCVKSHFIRLHKFSKK
jgi:linoleoyl-CoA desaturase